MFIKLLVEGRYDAAFSEINFIINDIIDNNQCCFESYEETWERLYNDPMYSRELTRLMRYYDYAWRKTSEATHKRLCEVG